MLRRVFDGLLIALVAWFALARLDAGGVAVGLVLAAVLVFTGWRIVRLWRRYRYLLARLAEAEALKLSDDPAERQRAARILRERSVMQAAEMSIWTGFFLGAAAVDASHAAGHGGYEGIGADMSGGDFGGGFDGGGGGV
jgi:uncharacterized membrane protein YgcG